MQSVAENDAEYGIKVPSEDTDIVQDEIKKIREDVNLKALVNEQKNVRLYIHIASVGVTAAGHTELQIKVQKIGFSVAKLGRKSRTAVMEFRSASRNILETLQFTYQRLLLGKEESALRMLEKVIEVAEKMSKVAKDLQYEFDCETENVSKLLHETMSTRGLEQEKREKIAQQLHEFAILKQKAELARNEALKAREIHWGLFEDARRKQYKALKKSSNPFKMIVNAFTSVKFGFPVFGDGTNKEMAEAAQDEKLTQLKYVQEQQVIQQEAAQQVAEFMMRIENCKDSSKLADIAIEALQTAIGGLKALSVVMMMIADFWNQLHNHVVSLQKPALKSYISEIMDDTEEERKKQWNSPLFKTSAAQYCAQWVALESVCTQYTIELRNVQEGVYKVLKDNPNEEEALVKLNELAKEYRQVKEEEENPRSIEDRSTKVDRDIRQLEGQT